MNIKTNIAKRSIILILIVLLLFIFEYITKHKIDRIVNKIFIVNSNEYLKKSIFGDIYFELGNYLTSNLNFIENNDYSKYQYKSLKNVIDFNSFEFVKEYGSQIFFEDKLNEYIFHDVEGEFLTAQSKEK